MVRPLLAPLLISVAISAGLASNGAAQQTPPIAPNIQTTPLPPPVGLPAPPAPPPADVPSRPLTADEAALIALRHQPNVTVARANVAAAQGRTQQVRAGLLPNLSLSAGYTHQETLATEGGSITAAGGGTTGGTTGTTGTTGAFPGYQAAVTVRQLLFDFNHTRDLVRQAQALERTATATLTRVQADLVLQVKQAFYNYVQNVRLVDVNTANVRNRQAQLDLAQARLRAGLGLPSDVVRAQTAVADAIFTLNQAQNSASVARASLALLMGIDPRTPIDVTDTGEPPIATNDVNALVTTALAQRPEVQEARSTVQAAQYGVGAARTTNAPSFGANLSLFTRGANFPPGNDFFSVGVSVAFPLYDAGLTAGLVKEARATLESAQAQLTNTQLTVTSDVSQAYLNLRTAEQRVTTADAEVANAEESVRLAEGRYRAGLGTFLDVLDAQTSLLTARTNRVNAQTAVNQARAALTRAIGTPIAAPR
ncbi:MAG TPA: TolC family protein [Chthonomonadaceae bacterium]|nr:TolC family protein [Chthonomonadaceae bacterium]